MPQRFAIAKDAASQGVIDCFDENNSAGFGPYRLDQLQRGQQAVFKARPDYYLGKPAMDTVIFREVPTSATRAPCCNRA